MSRLERLEKDIEKLKKLLRKRPPPTTLDCSGVVFHPGVKVVGKINLPGRGE
jgi:hypothetical protein